MKTKILVVALLISMSVFAVIQNRGLLHQLEQKNFQLQQTETELKVTRNLLRDARQKLGFLDKNKAQVQVTAFATTPEFGDDPHFANGRSTRTAYAVRSTTLPEDAVVNIALSAPAQAKLRAKMNDIIVLMDKRGRKKIVARFVDTTAPQETRPVVDVYFASAHQARLWGRHFDYVAVNISAGNSPFLKN
jgi:hypothetical protein